MTVEQVVTDDTYLVLLVIEGHRIYLAPDRAEALAYALTEAALEPDRCLALDCGNYAAPGEDNCPAHLADAEDDLPDYADWRQA